MGGERDWGVPPDTLVIPPGAGPGEARIVIGPDLPPPLDTYTFSGGQTYASGIIFYADGSDTTYTYLCVVEDTTDQDIAIHFGHVNGGVVVEESPGVPQTIRWLVENPAGFQAFSVNTDQVNLTALVNGISLTASAASGDISLTATDVIALSAATILGSATSAFTINGPLASLLTMPANGNALLRATEPGATAQLASTGAGGTADVFAATLLQLRAIGTGADIDAFATDDIRIRAGDDIDLDAAGEIQVQGTRAYLMTQLQLNRASGGLTLNTTQTTIPNCTFSLPTVTTNARYKAEIVMDTETSVAGTGIAIGRLVVNGVTQAQEAIYQSPTAGTRMTVTQNYEGTLAAAGSHSFTFQALKTAGTATLGVGATHCTLRVTIYESGG